MQRGKEQAAYNNSDNDGEETPHLVTCHTFMKFWELKIGHCLRKGCFFRLNILC
jgi:hypothetical protein